MVCVYGPVPALLNTTFLYEWHDQLLREDNPKAGAMAPEKIIEDRKWLGQGPGW